MPNVFIIHGTGGNPKANWFPWLKDELQKLGCKVFVPKFPTPENQSLENWRKVFEEFKPYLESNSIVVGHSLGVAFLLDVIERLDKPNRAAFLIAGFASPLNSPGFDELVNTFVNRSFSWSRIRRNCRKFYVINSDNDPYVPLEQGRNIAKNLKTELIVLKNAGHINKEAGYTKFDFLLEKMKAEL